MFRRQIETYAGVSGGTVALPMVVQLREPVRALTALRGIAAWWIVIFHFREALPLGVPDIFRSVAGQGYLAVDLFFILSGYVIGLNYANRFAANPTMRTYIQFLLLRLSRLYPLHAVVLGLFLVNPLVIALFSHQGTSPEPRWDYFGLSLLLMQNWGFTTGTAWNVPAWSISTEWFACLCFPVVAGCGLATAGSTLRSAVMLCGILGLIAAVTVAISPAGLGYGDQRFEMFRCLAEFLLGTVIVHFERVTGQVAGRRGIALLLALACFTVTTLCPIPDYVFIPAGFAATVYALADENVFLSRWMRAPALQWLGLMSYSTYLCHYLLKTWTKFVFVGPVAPGPIVFLLYLAGVLAASDILHRFVERPGQYWCRKRLRSAGLI